MDFRMGFQIAIDGPAGAGKSTVAKEAARRLGFVYVDTGAMYRAMALYILRKGIDKTDLAAMGEACKSVSVTIEFKNKEQRVLLNGEDVTESIRDQEVGKMASISAAQGDIRKKLADMQRELAVSEDVVMDGRDIGTNVLTEAELKIYLTATVKERARRRYEQLKENGESPDLHEIEAEIAERDYRDQNREIAPLKQAEDAVYLDTSCMTIEEVIQKIIELCQKRREDVSG